MVLTPLASYLQLRLELELPQAVCGTWLYNCLTPTCFLWAYASSLNSTTSTGQGDIPISSTRCTCFAAIPLIYIGASLDWRLGRGSKCYTRYRRECYSFHFKLHLPLICTLKCWVLIKEASNTIVESLLWLDIYIYIYVCVCVCVCFNKQICDIHK